jgi:hypothetical protein
MPLKILKYLGIFLASIVILAGGGLWYANVHAPTWAKNYAHTFGQSTGYLIDFNDLKISLGQAKVSLSDLKIIELANQQELLNVKHLEVTAKWGPLFQKKVELSHVVIDEPHILAEKYPDNWNWLRFIAAVQKKFPKKPDEKPKKPMQFLVDQMSLTNGLVKIKDPESNFDTTFTPLNIELLKATNVDSQGEIGGLETKYAIDLGDVTLPIPKKEQKLHLGHVVLGGDFALDGSQDMVVLMKAKIEQGLINTTTHLFKAQNKIESDITLDQLSLVPLIDLATPKVARNEKSGVASGHFKLIHQGKNNVVDGDLNLDDVSVVPFISLVPTINSIYAKSGGTSGVFKIHYDPELTTVVGDIKLNQLGIFETDKTSQLIGWNTANVNHFDYEKNPRGQKLKIEEVKVDGLDGRFVIYGDKSSNFRRMFKPSNSEEKKLELERKEAIEKKPETKKDAPISSPEVLPTSMVEPMFRLVANQVVRSVAPIDQSSKEDDHPEALVKDGVKKPFNFNIKSIEIIKGKIEFSDFSVKPNFKTDIHNFHGTLIGISSYPKRYATGAFDGLIAPSGDMKLKGQIAFADARHNNDINLSFRRIPLSAITPYATTFMGYQVKDGTLSYDSSYVTKEGLLKGDNRFVINQIQLGDKIPDYKGKSLPLETIIALLEDENGVIDLNLKVEGHVDKPDFKIGELIWDAVWTILGNVVTAPFKMIGRLMGVEGYTGIYFDPGSSNLRPSESLKLENLSAGLAKHPKSKLKINGVYDPEVDKLNLSMDRVDREIFKSAGFKLASGEPLPELPLEDERVQRAISMMYAASGATPKIELKLAAGPAGVADWKVLHDEIVAKGQVTDEEIQKLADTRAKVIHAELVKIKPDIASRLNVVASKKESAVKDGIPVGIEMDSN